MRNFEKVYVELKDAEGVTHSLALYRAIEDSSELYPSTEEIDDWWINNNNLDIKLELAWPETFGAVVIAEHPSAGKKEFICVGGDQWAAAATRGWEDISPEDRIQAAGTWMGLGWRIEKITERGYE